jgi:hypothetical protein
MQIGRFYYTIDGHIWFWPLKRWIHYLYCHSFCKIKACKERHAYFTNIKNNTRERLCWEIDINVTEVILMEEFDVSVSN